MFRLTGPLLFSRRKPVGLVAIAGLLLLTPACQPEPAKEQAANSATDTDQPTKIAPPRKPAERPLVVTLGRADLIAAFSSAADATAAGRPLPDANKGMIGRTFILNLPFGCDGQTTGENPTWAGWTFDQKRQALKVFATPQRWTDAAWIGSIAGDMAFEAVEGFWIERPWTSSENCPVARSGEIPVSNPAPEQETVGIAQFFAPNSPRSSQRGARSYSHTLRVPVGEQIEGRTYRLSLGGRVTGFADGQPVHCRLETPNSRPVCLIAVELARIAIEDPREGNVLVEWRN